MKWLIPIVFIGLTGLFLFTSDLKFFSTHQTSEETGRILSVEGTVMGRASSDPFFQDLEINSPLMSGQKVLTGFNSQSLIEFGETFLLMANSSIRLLKTGSKYQVHLLAGEIKRDEPGHSTEFLIDNQATQDKVIRTGQLAAIADFPTLTDMPNGAVPGHKPNTKVQALLQDTFRLHQRYMEKCFIKHYERKQGQTQSGVVWLEFNIEKTGNFSQIQIKKSDFVDPQFHQCITEVVSRVQLKFYDGDFEKIDFPVQINLPN